ncbi:MDR family MFS transporter [Paenisporosarcina cavernae]|uniref:MDR family MFS transporter n=1 Tax=Paenisporosarcina cavernae TaxID=2320858 RepID=UPI001EE50F63|nr:MFS transporter [Paenisporosarcina cavernae]
MNKFAFHPMVWTLLLGTMFARGASFMALPFLALYLSNTHGVHPILIGITIGLSRLTGMFGGFIGGYLSDRFGRKVIMLSSIFIWAFVYIGFSIADHIYVFMALNAVNGICRSFFEPSSQALMADVTTQELKKRVFSLRYMAINIGAAVGPLIGVYVAKYNSTMPFFLTGCMYLLYAITLVIMFSKFPVSRVTPVNQLKMMDAFQAIAKDRVLLLFILGGTFISFSYSQIDSNLPQFIEQSFGDGISLFATLIAINAIIVVILQLPLGLLSEKWPVLRTVMIGSLLFAIGFGMFGFASTFTGLIAAMVIVTIGEIFIFPSTSVFIDAIAPDGKRGTYFGANQLQSLGGFAGPMIGGAIFSGFGGSVLFQCIFFIVLFGCAFYAIGNKAMQKRSNVVSM